MSAIDEWWYVLIICVSVFLAYFICSFIVRVWPRLLHGEPLRPTDPRLKVRHMSHRGCIGEAEDIVENSLKAFQYAIDNGTDLIELDVLLTRDHQVVVVHDNHLLRLTGEDVKVTEKNYSDLPKLKQNQTSIPLLSEVLNMVPSDICLIIEFKQESKILIEKVHSLIKERPGKEKSVVWYSLKQRVNLNLAKYDGSLPRIVSLSSMIRLAALYHVGILPFLPHRFLAKEEIYMAFYNEINYDYLKRVAHDMTEVQKIFFGYILRGRPSYLLAPAGLLQHLSQRGIPVWLVGINEQTDLIKASRLGCTGFLTDKPRWLYQALKAEQKQQQTESTRL